MTQIDNGNRGCVDKCAAWVARISVGIVFLWNVQCALSFLMFPEKSVAAYELSGAAGETAIRGIAVAFLMWNVTFPLVIFNPRRHRTLFGIVLSQQVVGLLGEGWIYLNLQLGHDVLAASILRFILFDAAGLIIMTAAFIALMITVRRWDVPETRSARDT